MSAYHVDAERHAADDAAPDGAHPRHQRLDEEVRGRRRARLSRLLPGDVDDKGLLRTELSADDLHPNAQGYAIMGPLAEAAIKQALR